MAASLQRLVIGFERDGVTVRALYRTQQGPGPSTKARRREVAELVRTGLEQALEPSKAAHPRRHRVCRYLRSYRAGRCF